MGVLIVFAVLGSFICARSRSASGAIFFGVLAVVLFVTTPMGAGLPGAVSSFVDTVGNSTGPVLDGSTSRGVG